MKAWLLPVQLLSGCLAKINTFSTNNLFARLPEANGIIISATLPSPANILFMTLYQFNDLDEGEQIEAILDSVEIGKRKDDIYNYTLHQIGSFYVEVQRHREEEFIRNIKSFTNIELLDLYLNGIDIRGIK